MTMGPNVLLIGPSGTGKTYSLRTAKGRSFILFTEPGMESVEDVSCKDGLHYRYIAPATPNIKALLNLTEKVRNLDVGALANLKDPHRREYDAFPTLLKSIADFKCDRCGESFGDLTELPPEDLFAIDSLTGLSVMAMQLVAGLKPIRSMQDWQVAQNVLENFIQTMCTSTKGTFALIGHVEREVDEVSGGHVLTASTLGRKLAPKLTRFFSDVIMAVRDGNEFRWSTVERGADLKARNVDWSSKLPPSFEALQNTWESRIKGQ